MKTASLWICPSEEKQGCLESRGTLLCPLALVWSGTMLNFVPGLHLFRGLDSLLVHVLEVGQVNTHLCEVGLQRLLMFQNPFVEKV